MNRKTFTFEEFEDLYASLITHGMCQIGHKEHVTRFEGEEYYTHLRLLLLRDKINGFAHTYCVLDNHMVVELSDHEVESLLFTYETYHYSPIGDAFQPDDWIMTDFDKQEADKLYIELSGHEPNDSYEWLKWPDGISLREPLSYPSYYFSN